MANQTYETQVQRSTPVSQVNDPLFGFLLGWDQAGPACRVFNCFGIAGSIIIAAFLSGGNTTTGFLIFAILSSLILWAVFWMRVNDAVREGISHGRNR